MGGCFPAYLCAQAPHKDLPAFITFGKGASPRSGDLFQQQVILFSVPVQGAPPTLWLRIWDPETGGMNDEINGGAANTTTRFSVYGGQGAFLTPPSWELTESGIPPKYCKKGSLLMYKEFGADSKYDNKFYSFGPINVKSGEKKGDRYYFKLVVEGQKGDDGNIYNVQLSADKENTRTILGAKAFAYWFSIQLTPQYNCVQFRQSEGLSDFVPYIYNLEKKASVRPLGNEKSEYEYAAAGKGSWSVSHCQVGEGIRVFNLMITTPTTGARNNVTILGRDQNGSLLKIMRGPFGLQK